MTPNKANPIKMNRRAFLVEHNCLLYMSKRREYALEKKKEEEEKKQKNPF